MDEKPDTQGITLDRAQFLAGFKKTPIVQEIVTRIAHRKSETPKESLFNDLGPHLSAHGVSQEELKELSKYYDQALIQLVSAAGAANSQAQLILQRHGQHTNIFKKNNKILLTTTWVNPTFSLSTKNFQTPTPNIVPGKITCEFEFNPIPDADLPPGLNLTQVSFNSPLLFSLIKNPLETLSEKPTNWVIEDKKCFEKIKKSNFHLDPYELKTALQKAPKNASSITLMDPVFQDETHLVTVKIPGTVTIHFTDSAKTQFKSMQSSNPVLHEILLSPPDKLSRDELILLLTEMKKVAGKLEKNPAQLALISGIESEKKHQLVFTQNEITAVLANAKPAEKKVVADLFVEMKTAKPGSHQLKRDQLGFMKVSIPPDEEAALAPFFRQDMMMFPNYIIGPNCSNQIILNSDNDKTFGEIFHNEMGETICRITYLDPRFVLPFLESGPYVKNIPGKMTLEYVFEHGHGIHQPGFKLRTFEFSNAALKNLVLGPPKNPTSADLDKIAQQATQEEQLRHTEKPSESMQIKRG